jgi:4-azaleucine resistance transporter AzlC
VSPSRRAEFVAGVKRTLPLVVGAVPFGLIFGAVAVTSGLSPAASVGLSTFVFAGSAQFVATGLVAGGASLAVIVLTTFVVNLRHALYSASLAPYMKHLPQRWLAPLAFGLTDETFVVVIQRYEQPDASPYKHWFFLGSEVIMYLNWQFWTWVGVFAGRSVPDLTKIGLDFALVVTFIAMIVPMVKSRSLAISVIVAGAVALLANGLPNKLGLIIAALLGVLAGFVAQLLLGESPADETEPTEVMP